MSKVYISPTGSGDKSGSSWANAASISMLDAMIKKAGQGGTVVLAADKGAYKVSGLLNVTGFGVTITGMNSNGTAGDAHFIGTRMPDWKVGGAVGNELFRIQKGADGLTFENMSFENVGTVFRVGGDVKDLTVQHMHADNVRRFFEDLVTGSNKTATISGLTLRDIEVDGFSKGVVRLQYDTNDVLIEDVRGDSQRQVGDDFTMGVHLDDTVHDVVLRRVTMANATQEAGVGKYWNGDGFAAESKTYNLYFEDTVARGGTDSGYDLKASHVTMVRALAEDNAKNFRFWGKDVTLIDPVGLDPQRRGGTNAQEQVWLADSASVKVVGGRFSDSGSNTKVFDNGGRLELVDTVLTYASNAKAYVGKKPVGFSDLAVSTVAATGSSSQTAAYSDGSAKTPSTPTSPLAIVAPVVVTGDATSAQAGADWTRIKGTAANEVLQGTRAADMFVFDQSVSSGADTIRGFSATDVIVFRTKLGDADGDGVTSFGKDKKLDMSAGSSLVVDGLENGLRLLGEVAEGYAYGDAGVWKAGATLPKPAAVSTFTSKAAAENFVAANARETFIFDVRSGGTGSDTIHGFGADDVMVSGKALADGNGDGLIVPGRNGVDLGDKVSSVKLVGLEKNGLRTLGVTEEGFIYADAAVRPKGALEGKLGVGDVLLGGKGDVVTDRFFFDTALHRALGEDQAVQFGAKDVVITTSRLGEGDLVRAEGGAFRLEDEGVDLGGIRITDLGGRAVDMLEFDGSQVVNGVEYFVYSTAGSAIGLDALIG